MRQPAGRGARAGSRGRRQQCWRHVWRIRRHGTCTMMCLVLSLPAGLRVQAAKAEAPTRGGRRRAPVPPRAKARGAPAPAPARRGRGGKAAQEPPQPKRGGLLQALGLGQDTMYNDE